MIPWSDTTKRRIGLVVIAAAVAFTVTDVAVSFSLREAGAAAEMIILATAFGVVTTLSIRAVPHNGAVWALIWAMFFGAAGQLGETIGVARTGFTTMEIEEGLVAVAPSEIDTLAAFGLAIALSAWVVAVFLLANHLLILFPGGSAGSARWRWVAWASALSMAAFFTATFLAVAPWVDRRYDEIYGNEMGAAGLFGLLILVLMLVAAASLVHLVRRFRRSAGEERLQYRWVTFALALQVLSILAFSLIGLLPDPGPALLGTVALALVPVSFGIAITKYRLYDIDIIINRTLVFLGLAVFITAVYVAAVVGIGSLLSGSDLWLSIAATALVAFAFEPVREWLQRWANRLVYGQRATPYQVLSDLTGRLAATESEEGLLDRMALRLAEGIGADRVVIWVTDASGFRAAACEPSSDRPIGPENGLGAIPGRVVPIEHDGEVLGALSVSSRRGDSLTPTETRLVEDLAGSAGLLMRRLRLDAELEQKARELAESRRRLVDVQDVERRRLERELNEGAQQQVVALKLKLGLAARQAERDRSDKAAMMIEQMGVDAQAAIDQIRALAQGIYPPLLEAHGLAAALSTLARLAPMEVQVEATVTDRHPLAVEAAMYFCVSEALTNAAKHGEAPITVAMSDAGGEVAFEVSDSGPGFDPQTVRRGAGLNNMTDRLDALGGTLTVASYRGGPTTIAGRVPVSVPAAV